MIRSKLWLFPIIGLLASACAGELTRPERFEGGESAASTADGSDASEPATTNDDRNGDASTSSCGSSVEMMKLKCATAGCHGASSPAAGLDLISEGVGKRLRDVTASAACEGYALIDSKDPSRSLLYLKVTDTPPCEPRMPIGAPLSETEQSCLLEWIEQL